MMTGSVIGGNAVVDMIVCTPAPGMLNVIVSSRGVELAQSIAARSEPGPLSFVLVTTRSHEGGGA